jgi:hypothetical protein
MRLRGLVRNARNRMPELANRVVLVVLLALGGAVTVSASDLDGRWKIGAPGECYWDAYDSGPDQCDPNNPPPPPSGRWKVTDTGQCYFDEYDSGPDQCDSNPFNDGTIPSIEVQNGLSGVDLIAQEEWTQEYWDAVIAIGGPFPMPSGL